jgi:branched-chain amino acid transport system substrate-binding protein
VKDAKPDALFVFVPSGAGRQFMKQFVERGLDKSGIKLIGPATSPMTTSLEQHGRCRARRRHRASCIRPRIPRPMNKAFVEAFRRPKHPPGLHGGRRLGRHAPDLRGAEEDRRQPTATADRAMKGMSLGEPARPDLDRSQDPRHRPEHLCPQGREGDGELYNVEFATFEAVPDPGKTKK